MKQRLVVFLLAMALAAIPLGGCRGENKNISSPESSAIPPEASAPSQSESPVLSAPEQQSGSSPEDKEQEDGNDLEQMLYSGIVTEIGDSWFTVQGDPDQSLPYESVRFEITSGTVLHTQPEPSEPVRVACGMLIEKNNNPDIKAEGVAQAIAVNTPTPQLESLTFDGEIIDIYLDGKDGGLITVKAPGSVSELGDYRFSYNKDTRFSVPVSGLKVGDLIHVVHSPIATFSIPPQSPAFSIEKAQG